MPLFDAIFEAQVSPTIDAFFGETLTLYRRSNSQQINIVGVISYEVPNILDDGHGNYTTVTTIDIECSACEYRKIGSDPIEGDRFKTVCGDIFEVMPIDSEKCFRAADKTGRRYTIHTKRVKEVPK